MKKKRILHIIFVVFIQSNLPGQDVQFSQLFADKLYLNPAYAGSDYCPRFVLNYRNQWPGIQSPFVTYSATFDKYAPALNGGIGIRVMKDDQGDGTFSQVNADFIYSYHAKLNHNWALKLALEASIYQKSMNVRDLVFYNMIDPVQGVVNPSSETLSNENFLSPDFSAGMLINYKSYFVGFSANHIPHMMVDGHSEFLPMKYTAHAGAAIPIIKNDSQKASCVLEPNVIYVNQQNMNMLYYGMYFDIENMSFGLFYRQNLEFHFDAMIVSYHLKIKNFNVGYSYDVTLSRFIAHTLGSHELSLGYLLPCDKKIRKYNTISCPTF